MINCQNAHPIFCQYAIGLDIGGTTGQTIRFDLNKYDLFCFCPIYVYGNFNKKTNHKSIGPSVLPSVRLVRLSIPSVFRE